MKPVNLLSLVNAKNDLQQSVFDLFLSNFEIKMNQDELDDLGSLVNQIETYSPILYIFDRFYVGFTIKQISKQFDLLRFGENSIINIELKKESTMDKIKKQLIRNKYYLSFLEKKIFNFTYVSENKKLFYLDENEELEQTNFDFLITKLKDQKLELIEDIDKLFDPSNYLVSPFNSTEAFISGGYFLTDHQEAIKDKILKLKPKTGPNFVSIQGAAGTGKTLLTYDIAKEYINNSKNVIIFHCGNLNHGQNVLCTKYCWVIAPIKSIESYDLTNYDLIIIDEIQRIRKPQLNNFLDKVKSTNAKCIFAYDPKQCLSRKEIQSHIPQYIEEKVSPAIFVLTEKIRTNKEIASFIKNLFDLSKRNSNQKYSNVNVQYFSNADDAKECINMFTKKNWKIINYTPSQYDIYPYDEYQNNSNATAHEVIGQEYDNVVAVIDKYFYYNEEGLLSTKGFKITPCYYLTGMLFQILTRARKKISLIIINNEIILNQCLKILQHK